MARSLISEDFVVSKVIPIGLFVLSILLCLTKAGTVLNIGFPILAALVGLLLYVNKPLVYLSFTLWTWMLTPLIRRMSDFQGAYHPVSVMLIAPLAVTALSVVSVFRYRRHFDSRAALPFVVVAFVLLYGFFIGVLHGGVASAALGLANWGLPVVFAVHVLILPYDGIGKARVMLRALVFGGVVIGGYAIAQFALLPKWDSFWMIQSELASIGRPFPFQVRVFSTMNSPGPFAQFVVTCSLAAFITRSRLRWISIIFSVIGLLLSLVRSSWGSWLVCLVLLFYWAPRRQKGSYIVVALASAVIVTPVIVATPIGSTVSDRISGLSDVSGDQSYAARSELYANFTATALTSIVGVGLGQTNVIGARVSGDDQAVSDVLTIDSGVLEIFYSLGILAIVMFWSLTVLIARSWPRPNEPFTIATFIVAFAAVPAIVFGNTIIAQGGMLFYPFLAATLALKAPSKRSHADIDRDADSILFRRERARAGH